jgi:hypothetical protein
LEPARNQAGWSPRGNQNQAGWSLRETKIKWAGAYEIEGQTMLVSGEGMKRVLGGLLLALSLVMSALVLNGGLGLAQVQAQTQTKSQFVPLVRESQSQMSTQVPSQMPNQGVK